MPNWLNLAYQYTTTCCSARTGTGTGTGGVAVVQSSPTKIPSSDVQTGIFYLNRSLLACGPLTMPLKQLSNCLCRSGKSSAAGQAHPVLQLWLSHMLQCALHHVQNSG